MKNLTDSVSYAIGMSVAQFYSQQGIRKLNTTLVSKAINDVLNGGKRLLNDEQAQTCVMRMLNPEVFKKIEAGEQFLTENKKKPGIKTTASGLQYEVITQGTGARPAATDTVEVNYRGT